MSAITRRLCCARMKLADIASGDAEVRGIAYDSRRVKAGDLFIAVTGLHEDGHVFAADAVARGAVAVALQRPGPMSAGTPVLYLPSTRIGLAEVAAEFYGRPARRLRVAGITGTDGKTTTTHMAEHVLQASGMQAGARRVTPRHVMAAAGRETQV